MVRSLMTNAARAGFALREDQISPPAHEMAGFRWAIRRSRGRLPDQRRVAPAGGRALKIGSL
jgi:hypothetical protein